MKRTMINWLGILGVVSLISYTIAVIFAPLAFTGYNWMEQAVSDLSADTAPSKQLWSQLSALYGKCGLVSIMCVCLYVSEHRISSKLFRVGIYLFAAMNWVSAVGFDLFPLSESGKGMKTFQDIMHVYVVTSSVVLLSIVSLSCITISGIKGLEIRHVSIWASIALAMMFVGAIGTGVVPTAYFGIVERFSVFAATGFNAVLGMELFLGFRMKRK